jgi:superfamily II DNA or RNA helicase
MIAKLKTKTLIIVPNTYLLKQWAQLLIQLFPNNKIGEYYSKSKIDGDIVVSIINSCIQDKFQYKNAEEELSIKDYYKQFNFILLDECHMYCTQTFGEVFNRIQSTYMLGLSATPDERLDGFDTVARYHLGDIIDVENIEDYNKEDIKFTSNVKIIKYNGPDEFAQVVINEKNNMINVPAMISNFIIDEHRNSLIVNETIKLLGNNHNIFIFSDRRSHLQILSELLVDKVNTDHKIILYGGSTDDDIELAQKNSKIILTTYQYSSTGVSISKMDALILSTPRRNNMTQIIGRIFRLNKETQGNLRSIIDIVDNKNPLKFQFNSRKSAYLARGATLKFETIYYENIIC